MAKMKYEKPDMLVETFVATQSVAANCGWVPDYDPMEIGLNDLPMKICNHKKCDHYLTEEIYNNPSPNGKLCALKEYDKNDSKSVTIFNGKGECEIVYEDYGVEVLGNMLTRTGAWDSPEHQMVIRNKHIPS